MSPFDLIYITRLYLFLLTRSYIKTTSYWRFTSSNWLRVYNLQIIRIEMSLMCENVIFSVFQHKNKIVIFSNFPPSFLLKNKTAALSSSRTFFILPLFGNFVLCSHFSRPTRSESFVIFWFFFHHHFLKSLSLKSTRAKKIENIHKYNLHFIKLSSVYVILMSAPRRCTHKKST